MPSDVLNVEKQLVFYGAYHANTTNIAIHMVFVPMILWSWFVVLATFPTPAAFPAVTHYFSRYFGFEFNWAFLYAAAYQIYYILLEPVAGLSYLPQMAAMVLTANPVAHRVNGLQIGLAAQLVSWAAQIAGHKFAEKRAPAFIDNVLGALVLAPFFVHLEILFGLGYNKALHKKVNNGVGVEVTKFRREQAAKNRKAQ